MCFTCSQSQWPLAPKMPKHVWEHLGISLETPENYWVYPGYQVKHNWPVWLFYDCFGTAPAELIYFCSKMGSGMGCQGLSLGQQAKLLTCYTISSVSQLTFKSWVLIGVVHLMGLLCDSPRFSKIHQRNEPSERLLACCLAPFRGAVKMEHWK